MFPEFQSVIENNSWATASYQSGQFSVEKRFARGFQFMVNYTFAKSIDSASRGSQAFSGQGIANPFNLETQRGISDLHVPHVLVANWIYETPLLQGANGFVRQTLGGWQLSGIFRAPIRTPV